jgi:hypothetical protein
MYTLATTRFTNSTWESNINYRRKHNISGCIYGSPQEMSPKILPDSLVFVVEMNNETNNIEGIGLVRNRAHLDKYYNIYQDGNYNRFVYKSDYYLDREKLCEYNHCLVKALDYILFKEKSHLKRGSGFTAITPKLLASKKNELCKKLDLNIIINIIIKTFKKEYLIIHHDISSENRNENNEFEELCIT